MPTIRPEYLIGVIIIVVLGAGAILYQKSLQSMVPASAIDDQQATPIATSTFAAATSSASTEKKASSDTSTIISAPAEVIAKKAAQYQKAPELAGIEGYINTD